MEDRSPKNSVDSKKCNRSKKVTEECYRSDQERKIFTVDGISYQDIFFIYPIAVVCGTKGQFKAHVSSGSQRKLVPSTISNSIYIISDRHTGLVSNEVDLLK